MNLTTSFVADLLVSSADAVLNICPRTRQDMLVILRLGVDCPDIGVGTAGNFQFVANPGNYLSFELQVGNGNHSWRHNGQIVTTAGTVQFQTSDKRVKSLEGAPEGSALERILKLAETVQNFKWKNYSSGIDIYRYEQP